MEKQNHGVFSHGWRWLGVLALVTGLLLPLEGEAAERTVYQKEIEGMNIRVWLDMPMKMQMLMQGKWMSFRPKPGELTHHLGVDLTDPASGEAIPTAGIKVTLTHRDSGRSMTKELPAMFGKKFVYGANVKLENGTYDALVAIDPPTIMRMGPSMDKWQASVEVELAFEVK